MTLDELDHNLPNGFHDAEISSLELDYVAGIAKFQLSLLVGGPDGPEAMGDTYRRAILTITGLCFCSIGHPYPTYPFLPNGKPICVSGDPARPDHLPTLSDLAAKFPAGTWCYRFFVQDWNAFIHIAGRDAEVRWIGHEPKN